MSSFRKAVRTARKLRMSIQGPAGSGKTRTALELLTRIARKVAVIDTEHSSADVYAPEPGAAPNPLNGTFEFDACPMGAPFTPQAYINKINEAAREGYDGLIIDSLSHAWMGDGGILSMADAKGKRFDAWKELTPLQNKLMTAVLSYPGHIIVTMRTVTAYEVTKDERTGKSKPEKIGTKPQQKEGSEYEFDIVIDIDPEHVGHVTKSRCSEIEGHAFQKPGADLAGTIKRWLDAGEAPPAAPQKTTAERIHAGRKACEDIAGKLGGDAPSKLTERLDEIGPVVIDPEGAAPEEQQVALGKLLAFHAELKKQAA